MSSETNLDGRIFGGIDAIPGQLPHQLYLSIENNGKATFCGGVLIEVFDIQLALTAAHCVYKGSRYQTVDPNMVTVIAGKQLHFETGRDEQMRPVSEIHMHRQYDGSDEDQLHDIAVIFYSQPFQINSKVKTIDLPDYGWEQPSNPRKNFPLGSLLFYFGFL